jgi:hypothetical protein
MTNKPTNKAYEFFAGDPQAAKAVEEMIASGKPTCIVAQWLKEYMDQLSIRDHIRIYNELMVPVVEATNWDEVANLLLCDAYNITGCGSEVCVPEWLDGFEEVQ